MRAILALAAIAATMLLATPDAKAGYDAAIAAFERNDVQTALKEAREGAEQGDPRAMRLYGYMLLKAGGTKANPAEGIRWLRAAAEKDDTIAQRELAFAYFRGTGVPKDAGQAASWYRKAAEKNDALAQFMMAVLYLSGQGVAKNDAESARWMRAAADQGEATAQLGLAGYYDKGIGLDRDMQQAYFWASLAAKGKAPKAAAMKRDFAKDLTPEQKKDIDRRVRAWKPTVLAGAPGIVPEPMLAATGTGFVVSGDGHVVTNEHVIRSCKAIRVRGVDETVNGAKLVAASRAEDLALLKVEARTAAIAPFRSGAELRPGDAVVAFGFPMSGLLASSGNLTVGNVTALVGTRNNERFLQTSTPIQPGNSGGPLLDMNGRVVGVTTSSIPSLQNVNFAVKSEVVEAFVGKHGVTVTETGGASRAMKPADVGARAKRFTVRVECLA